MKKLISILLVAMLILGMFPATTLTASAEDGTWTLVTDASTLKAGDQLVFAETTNTKGDFVAGSLNGKYLNSIAATFSDNTIPTLPTSAVVFTLGGSSGKWTFSTNNKLLGSTAAKALALGSGTTTWTIAINSSDGKATIANTNSSYGKILYNRDSPRFLNYTSNVSASMLLPQLYRLETSGGSTEPEQPVCEHPNKVAIGQAVEATCTTPGKTAGEKCADCGEIITAQEEIPALGHNYVDGFCTECGEGEPAGYAEADVATLTNVDQVLVTITNSSGETYALTSGNGTSKAPAATKVTVNNGVIAVADVADTLIWNVVYSGGNIEIYPNGTTDTWLYCTSTNNGVRVGTNTAKVFTIDAASGYLKHTGTSRYLGVYNAQDWRCYTSPTTANIANQVLKFYKLGGGAAESCQHTNTEIIPAVAATCSTTGLTEGLKCSDCGLILTAQEPTALREHNFVDGICAYTDCGLYEQPAELMTVLPGIGDKIVMYSSNYAMGAEDNGSSKLTGIATTPVDGKLPYYTSVAVVTVGKAGDYYTFANAQGQYLTSGAEGGSLTFVTEEAPSDLAQWTIEAGDDNAWYIINKAASYNGTDYNQVIEVYYGAFTTYGKKSEANYQMQLYLVEAGEEACQHPSTTEQEDGYAPTCTQPGKTNSFVCDDCGVTTVYQTEIPALGHNFVDGECANEGCNEPDPYYALPGRYYIATIRSSGNYFYMTSDLGTAKNARYQAVDSGLTELPEEIEAPEFGYVFEIVRNEDGTFSILAEGIPENNYLGGKSDNVGLLVAADADNNKFTAEITEGGLVNFHFDASDKERYLGLNGTSGNNYFAWYGDSSSLKKDLVLIPVTGAATAPVAEADSRYFTTVEAAAAAAAENGNIVKLLAPVNEITYAGELKLDLNGHDATNVTATKIYAIDSSATATAEGDGSLTTTSEVVMDNTVDGVRYIALEKEGAYTFHVLDMKLSAVSLRTSAAGIYYKAIVNCDGTLAGAVSQYGIALSTRNMPGADFATENEVNGWTVVQGNITSGQAFTSGSVFGIFKEGLTNNAARGEVKIYANAYIIVDGTTIMADTTTGDKTTDTGFTGIAWSLKDVMVKLNETFTTLSEKNQEAVAKFYGNWSSAMGSWNLTAIADAAANLPA